MSARLRLRLVGGACALALGVALAVGRWAPPAQWTVRPPVEEADAALAGTPSFSNLPTGGQLFLDTSLPVATAGGLQLDARLWLDPATAASESVVFTIDMSSSALVPGEGCGGDFNGDGLADTVMDCELAAASAAIAEIGDWGTVSEVSIVLFELLGGSLDLQPAAGHQTFTAPHADLDTDGIPDAEEVLRSAFGDRRGVGASQMSSVFVKRCLFTCFTGTNFEIGW